MKHPIEYSQDPVMLIGALSDVWKKKFFPDACDPYFEWKLRGGPMFSREVAFLMLIHTSERIKTLNAKLLNEHGNEDVENELMICWYINDEITCHLSH